MVHTQNTSNSSNSLVSIKESTFKDNIVQKLGGEDQFQFLVITFCDLIQSDRLLKKCYKALDTKCLIGLLKDTILVSFLDASASECETLRSKLMLRYHLIFQEYRYPSPEDHFEALESNFVKAMRDCWVDEPVLEQCKGYFGSLRSVLKESGYLNQRMKMEKESLVDDVLVGMVLQVACGQ